ncbi:Ig-like domain-containing protein [Frigoribacterium sp. Leaf8]|uniref:Ig-like domain-containing protein n=1 Tax=Frigoribacterium sp. Leaf8 TaxID=1735673 RepID=UPI0012FA887C|nr:Ig-like domain-containing protein [Frigoribacterium sp. Leaf8]
MTVFEPPTLRPPRPSTPVDGRLVVEPRHGRRVASTLATVVLGLSLALSGGVGALAAGSPSGTPAPGPSLGQSPPGPVAPTIGDVGDRDVNAVVVGGTGTPGATVRVLDPRVPSRALCEVTLPTGDPAGVPWSCPVTLEDGADQTLTVRDVTNAAVVDDAVSAPFSVLGPPTVQGGPAVGGKVAGTAFPGARITVGGGAAPVSATADDAGAWSAVLPSATWPTGRYTVTASQSSDSVPAVPRSSTSTGVTVTIDRDPPAPPAVLSPRAGERVASQPLTFSGTGEDGATVTAYVDSTPVCQATVSGGAWACTSSDAALADGEHVVQAAQIDPSVNVGPPSAGISITVTSSAAQPAPPSSSAAPAPTAAPGASGGAVPSEPSPGTPGAPGTGDGPGGAPGGDGEVPPEASTPTADSWAAATTFGRDLPSLGRTMTGTGWLIALGLAAAFVLLVVAPARLLATAMRGRLAPRAPRLTGRNRRRELPTSFSTATLDPRLAAGLTIAAGAAVVGLAAGLDDEVRYARLFAGIVVGVALVNVLAVVVPTLVMGRSPDREARIHMSPRLLLVAVVACAVTRSLGLDPPLVLGVVLVGSLAAAPRSAHHGRTGEVGDREAGLLALVQVAALVVVAAGAWAVHGALPATGGFFTELALETSATVCLTGLGSLVLALVPVGSLPGRRLWAWSRPLHVALTVVGVTAAAAVLTGGSSSFPIGGAVVAAAVTAGLCVAAWLWTSFVEIDTDDA